MSKLPMWQDPQESPLVRELLQAGRATDALDYDVEAGLAKHMAFIQAGVPTPSWGEELISAGGSAAGGGASILGLAAKVIGLVGVAGAAIGAYVALGSERAEPTPSALRAASHEVERGGADQAVGQRVAADSEALARHASPNPSRTLPLAADRQGVDVAKSVSEQAREMEQRRRAWRQRRQAQRRAGAEQHQQRADTQQGLDSASHTFERGAQAEQLAMGTGASTASASRHGMRVGQVREREAALPISSEDLNPVVAETTESRDSGREPSAPTVEPGAQVAAPQPRAVRADESSENEALQEAGNAREAEAGAVPRQAPDSSGLEREMLMLKVAQDNLGKDPARALQLVDAGEREFSGSMFTQERHYLRIAALAKLDRGDEARSLALAYLKKFPRGPFSDRVRQALRTSVTD